MLIQGHTAASHLGHFFGRHVGLCGNAICLWPDVHDDKDRVGGVPSEQCIHFNVSRANLGSSAVESHDLLSR